MHLGNRTLVCCAVATEAVYLAATLRLPWWRYGTRLDSWRRILVHESTLSPSSADIWMLVACGAGLLLLSLAYLIGWRAVRAHGVSRSLVWIGAITFAATLLWLLPITADLYVYLGQAHIFTDLGANPFRAAPLGESSDRLLQAFSIVYAAKPTVYGPAWTLLTAPSTFGRFDLVQGVLYLKGLAAIAYLGSAWLLDRILRQTRPESALEGLYLFAWSPLVLLMAVGDGHNDIVMMAAVLLAMWLLLRRRWALASGALILSVWIKYVSVIFVPLCCAYMVRVASSADSASKRSGSRDAIPARPAVGRALVGAAVAALLTSVLVWAPCGRPDWVGGAVARLVEPANWQADGRYLPLAGLVAGVAVYAVVYIVLLWRTARAPAPFQSLADGWFLAALLALIVGAARLQPWHLIWPAALASLTTQRWGRPLVVALSLSMLGIQLWVEWGAPGAGIRS